MYVQSSMHAPSPIFPRVRIRACSECQSTSFFPLHRSTLLAIAPTPAQAAACRTTSRTISRRSQAPLTYADSTGYLQCTLLTKKTTTLVYFVHVAQLHLTIGTSVSLALPVRVSTRSYTSCSALCHRDAVVPGTSKSRLPQDSLRHLCQTTRTSSRSAPARRDDAPTTLMRTIYA